MLTDSPLTAATPDVSMRIPWAVALLLGSHSRKHIFIGNQKLFFRNLRDPLRDMVYRIKCQWHFRKSEGPPSEKPLLRRSVRTYKDMVPAEIAAFGRSLANAVRIRVLQRS